MSIRVVGKIGTMPGGSIEIKYARKPPKKGDRVQIRSQLDQRCYKWSVAIVADVNPDGYTFFTLM